MAFGTTYYIGDPGTDWRKLDIVEMIKAQDPRATPFFEISGMGSADSVKHEWQTRGVKARAVNAAKEGADFSYQEVATPTRVTNTCQILSTPIEITRTSQAEKHYGVASIMRDQINLRTYEHRADTEYNLIRNSETTGGTNAARLTGGLISVISTNATEQAGATLTETMYINLIELVWNSVDTPSLDAISNSKQRKIIDNFNSEGATTWVDTKTREIVNTVLRYHSSFGDVDHHLSRDFLNTSTTGELAMIDRSQFKKAYLRKPHVTVPAVTGDVDRWVIVSEVCLEYGNEEASGLYTQLACPN